MPWRVFVVGFLLAGPIHADEIRLDDLDHLPPANVLILGEIHDNPQHHANQARAVAASRPAALVFEMLTPMQAMRAPADRTNAQVLAKALGWNKSGWPDFAMYHPIFLAAPAAQIFGADVTQHDIARALAQGAAPVFGANASRYGLTEPLPTDEQSSRQKELAAAHCNALPADLLPGMVEVQRLRDASLARAIVMAMQATGGPVAVITGTGHARRDQGIPSVLAHAAPNLTVLSIGQFDRRPAADPPFDLWLVTRHGPNAGDPCATFGTEAGLDLRALPHAG